MDCSPTMWGLPGSSRLALVLHLNVDNSVKTCMFCGGDGWFLLMVYLWWIGVIIRICDDSVLIASWENVNSADSGAQGYLGVPAQPPARTALTSIKTVPGTCSELQVSSAEALAGYTLFLPWECYIGAGEGMVFCLLFGDSVLPYLQLLTCLVFKHFLQLL